MIEAIVLGFSIILQFVAAVLALRLIRVTGKYPAWTLIAAAIFLMALRRSITFGRLISGDISHHSDLLAEFVALIISLIMVLGIARIAPLFVSIKRSYEQLQESEARIRTLNEQVMNMLMVVSHDMRSPLISMAATLKLLTKGIYGGVDESVKNTLNDLSGRVARLIGAVEDCIGKTSVLKGSLDSDRQELDLRQDIIDPVLDELSSEIEEHNISIDNRLGAIPAHHIPVRANRVWLKTVLRNLFRNAIKYGGKGCVIAFGCENHNSYYQLNIYNSGQPIPENHRDKLFTKFFRVEHHGEKTEEGMGLGLFLVKEVIRRHGGDIWYEAKEDGSNFVFTLPCN